MLARFNGCNESVTPGDGGESYLALKLRMIKARKKILLLQGLNAPMLCLATKDVEINRLLIIMSSCSFK
jgi:hypothetical protein